uniref:Bestrophin homolog n=1 Tax=Romanomermis culicivorax TaxID=13658 RepID=A0A915JIT6_ROMCU
MFQVGEDLINPLGDDDDDFELNYVLDRNVQIAHLLADGVHGQLPPLQKDLYWGQANPHVPYTKASMKHKDKIFNGHLAKFSIPEDEQATVLEGEGEEILDDEKRAFLKFGRLITGMKKFSSSGKKNSKELQRLTETPKDDDPNRFSYISTSSQPTPIHFTYTEDES